jgi:hypothetical protein
VALVLLIITSFPLESITLISAPETFSPMTDPATTPTTLPAITMGDVTGEVLGERLGEGLGEGAGTGEKDGRNNKRAKIAVSTTIATIKYFVGVRCFLWRFSLLCLLTK